MKLARVAAAPLILAVCIPQACSDPPSPPAQGAVTIIIQPGTSGKPCPSTLTHNQVSMPAADASGVYSELIGCDLSMGCKPDRFVVVDRDRGATINCSVTDNGGSFGVSIAFDVDTSSTGTGTSMHFQANGQVNASGGTLSINEGDSLATNGGRDTACAIDIVPNFGVVKKGSIWAQFRCDNFTDPTDPSGATCTAKGAFIFENCTG